MTYIPKTKEWFVERIGKTVFRDNVSNSCSACTDVEKNGIIVFNKQHARYLAMIDADFAAQGTFMNYRDEKGVDNPA